MTQKNKFTIENGFGGPMHLVIEPLGATVTLARSEKVLVTEEFNTEPLTLTLSNSIFDVCVEVAIWQGDGTLVVEKDGANVLDL